MSGGEEMGDKRLEPFGGQRRLNKEIRGIGHLPWKYKNIRTVLSKVKSLLTSFVQGKGPRVLQILQTGR